jgi:ABC-type transport system involved in multi-copper enzyme maturation permease subunit
MRLPGEAILRRELLAILRSPRAFGFMAFYAVALSAVVLAVWPSGEYGITYQAERARRLYHLVTLAQFVLAALLAPVFSAGAITQEREKRSLDLLLTAPWSADTVTAGKYGSAVAWLLLLLLTSLPILALCLSLGGVLTEETIGCTLVVGSAAAAFGMVGLACSALFGRTYVALAVSYLAIAPPAGLLLLLFTAGEGGAIRLASLAEGVTIALLAAAAVLGLGLSVARRIETIESAAERPAEAERPEQLQGLVLRKGRFPDSLIWPRRGDDLIPDGVNPMHAKEIASELFGRGTLAVRTLILLSLLGSFGFFFRCMTGETPVYIAYVAAVILLIAPAFAANGFTQERERGTLDLLLTTRLTPWEIVAAKFRMVARSAAALAAFLSTPVLIAVILTLAVRTAGGGRSEFFLTLPEVAVHAAILAATIASATSIGLFISCRARTSLAAMVATYAAVFGLFVLPLLAHRILEMTQLPGEAFAWLRLLTPFSAAYSVGGAKMGRLATNPLSGPPWLAYVGLQAALAALLLALTWRRVARGLGESEGG